MTGRIFDIEHGSFVDGPGIRTVVFFKGCNLRCAWCHNPESQSGKKQLMVYRDKCIGCGSCACKKETCDLCGRCVLACPVGARKIVGEDRTAGEVLDEILQDRPFYGIDGGVTFTGGECMLQIDFLSRLLRTCKEAGIHTAVDTAGNVPWDSFERVLPYTDLFLYDVKLVDSDLHKKYTGAANALILSNLARLLQRGAKVWVRIPVLGGVNDSLEQMQSIQAFFRANGVPEKVELLPYHTMGKNKYPALNKECTPFSVPDKEHLQTLKNIFANT